jgi:hypothetical protein
VSTVVLTAWPSDPHCVDRSFQTAARAEPGRPGSAVANAGS